MRGNYVFFDADDGWNGGMGFAVYSGQTGIKLLEDAYVKSLSALRLEGERLHLQYMRMYQAPCSLYADTGDCWAKVKEATALGTPPDCTAAYTKHPKQKAANLPADNEDNDISGVASYLDYEVEVTVEHGQAPRIIPSGGKITCHISE